MAYVGQNGLQRHLRPDEAQASPFENTPIMIGRVIGRNPNHHALDVALLNGGLLRNIPMMTQNGSKNSGTVWQPPAEFGDGSAKETNLEDTYAIVAHLGGHGFQPVVIGFMFPEVSQLMGLPAKMYERRPNGDHTVQELNSQSVEHHYSDGSYFRVAEHDDTSHYDMAGQDFDGLYADQGGSTPRGFFLQQAHSGATYRIYKDGAFEVHSDLADEHAGNAVKLICGTTTVTVNVNGSVTITAPGGVNVIGSLKENGHEVLTT